MVSVVNAANIKLSEKLLRETQDLHCGQTSGQAAGLAGEIALLAGLG